MPLELVGVVGKMERAVVVPTLNEAGSIGALLDGILAADARLHVIVVDDGSTDGTTELVAERTWAVSRRVHLLARGKKLGFASALQVGMRYALQHGAELVLQMDADFSHDPVYLPDLIAGSAECDLVLGSRYVRGGGTRHWSLGRRALSLAGSLLARTLLKLPAHDCTGGFRCWHAAVLQNSGVLDLNVEGYAFQFAALDLCRRQGATVGEVPIIFADRAQGRSKMSRRIVWEAASLLFRLWRQNLTRPELPVSSAHTWEPADVTDRKAA